MKGVASVSRTELSKCLQLGLILGIDSFLDSQNVSPIKEVSLTSVRSFVACPWLSHFHLSFGSFLYDGTKILHKIVVATPFSRFVSFKDTSGGKKGVVKGKCDQKPGETQKAKHKKRLLTFKKRFFKKVHQKPLKFKNN